MFQSSPAPRRGRYAARLKPLYQKNCFNPRPRRGAGATSWPFGKINSPTRFNPRPRRGAGATTAKYCQSGYRTRFNPRPRRGAGATRISQHRQRLADVSILARAEARALRRLARPVAVPAMVSILARAEARALPVADADSSDRSMFQSSPAPRRGRYMREVYQLGPIMGFQSSPAPRRGRYHPFAAGRLMHDTFQSSPAPRRGRYTK